jgi:hypothetical protein
MPKMPNAGRMRQEMGVRGEMKLDSIGHVLHDSVQRSEMTRSNAFEGVDVARQGKAKEKAKEKARQA